jgi:hypothetical protein
MQRARNIIKYSKAVLSIILIPKTGNVESTIGSTAQCIAQAKEVVIPNASQLILNLILQR